MVDLPGYGYAKVPKDLQAHWQEFLDGYFATRMRCRGWWWSWTSATR